MDGTRSISRRRQIHTLVTVSASRIDHDHRPFPLHRICVSANCFAPQTFPTDR